MTHRIQSQHTHLHRGGRRFAALPAAGAYSRRRLLAATAVLAAAPLVRGMTDATDVYGTHVTLTEHGPAAWHNARVLGVRSYADAPGGAVAPLDLALASGPLAARLSDDLFVFHQRDRQLYWRLRSGARWPDSRAAIVRTVTNIHVVLPAPELLLRLTQLRAGEHINLSGTLVDVVAAEGSWQLLTSNSTSDEGPGACEVLRPEHLLVT